MGYNGCRGLEGSQIEQQQGQCERFFNRSNESWGSFDFARQARVRAKRKSSFSETDNIIANFFVSTYVCYNREARRFSATRFSRDEIAVLKAPT
jgi:hypothetical protein